MNLEIRADISSMWWEAINYKWHKNGKT